MAVFQKNGNWWIDYYYQDRRYRQKIGTKKKDAEEALSRIKVQIAAGEFVSPEERKREAASGPESVLFADFARDEFLPWSETQHSRNHYERQGLALRLHLIPYFEGRHLHEISTKQIEDFKSMRLRARYVRGTKKKPVNKATVNRELSCLKMLFRKAIEWGKSEENPAREVKLFKETPKVTQLLETDEIARLLEEVPDRLKALVACAVYAGLRKSELFRLQWKDINRKTGELTVRSEGMHHTKSYKSRRIPMNDALREALQRHPRRLDNPFVFCNTQGQTYDDVGHALNSAAERSGIDGGIGLHQLRHAFCSHALMQGVDPRTVQKWMGHKDLTTTLRYAHVSPDHEKEAIQRLRYENGHYMDTRAEEGNHR